MPNFIIFQHTMQARLQYSTISPDGVGTIHQKHLYTNSSHLRLYHNLTNSSEHSFTHICTLYGDNEQELGSCEQINACSFTTSDTTQAIPANFTEEAQVYRLNLNSNETSV